MCIRDSYRTVRSYFVPEIKFYAEPKQVQLPDAVVNILDSTKYASSYEWRIGMLVPTLDGFDTTNWVSITEPTVSYLFKDSGQYVIMLNAVSDSGCPATSFIQEITVLPAGVIIFPNAFTPNLEGGNVLGFYSQSSINNDVFHPYVPPGRESVIASYHLEIFSRWGILVFTSDDLKKGWDGYYQGKLCKQDVYAYKCNGTFVNGQTYLFTGDVTLLHKDNP